MKNGKKHFILGFATCLLLFALITSVLAAPITKTIEAIYNGIKISIDGKEVIPKDPKGNVIEPFSYNGLIYAPIELIAESLGKEAIWDEKTSTLQLKVPAKNSEGTKLTGLDYFTKAGTDFKFKEQQQANTGDFYSDCFVYDLGNSVVQRSGTRDYLLNGEYKKISGTIFLTYESRAVGTVANFSIWGDGKLIYTSEDVKAGSMPQTFEVDISGVKILKVGYGKSTFDGSYTQSWFATSNVILQ
ncbi:MAG: NPCBM/NEW2 domain-containing protein [Clostridiales bacterium]|jgi:hypothetical protein|nr:NPCBM/NEW2 domain-containing protein [Clostridiales bacterium]